MVALRCFVGVEELDTALASLYECDPAGMEEDEQPGGVWLTAYFADPDCAQRWAASLTGQPLEWRKAIDRDWSENWQSGWKGSNLGSRWYLAPLDDNSHTPPGRIRLEMTRGSIFGSGDHPTTQLCLELLESTRIVEPVLDLGTGTGILAIAAVRLGATVVHAADLDPAAIQAASAAAIRAGASISFWQGSLDSVRDSSYSLILCNLPGGLLLDLLPELSRVARPGGHLILSGLLDEQLGHLPASLAAAGLIEEIRRERDEWLALSCIKPVDRAAGKEERNR